MSFRFHCIRERETDNAVLVTEIEGDESIWIPLSQVESMHFDAKALRAIEHHDSRHVCATNQEGEPK